MNPNLPTTQKAPNALVLAFQNEMQGYLKLLPKELPQDRFKQFVMEALLNPTLASCSVDSVIVSVMRSAQAGLPIDGVLSALVPFKGQATFVIMAKGLLQLIRRGNKIRQAGFELVFADDEFNFNPVTREIRHVRVDRDRTDPDKVTEAYSWFRWFDGYMDYEVMTRQELDRVWRSSPAQNGPWKSHRCAMYGKTVLRRGAKRQPLPDEVLQALQIDEYAEEAPREAEVVDTGAKPPQTLQERAAERAATKGASPAVVQPARSQATYSESEAFIPPAEEGEEVWVMPSDGDIVRFVLAGLPPFAEWADQLIGGKSATLKGLTWGALRTTENMAAVSEARRQVAKAHAQVQEGAQLQLPVKMLLRVLAYRDEPQEAVSATESLFGDGPEDPA